MIGKGNQDRGDSGAEPAGPAAEAGAPGTEDEIEITPEMIAAGISVFHTWDSRFEEPEGFVIRLFEAMAQARGTGDNGGGLQ